MTNNCPQCQGAQTALHRLPLPRSTWSVILIEHQPACRQRLAQALQHVPGFRLAGCFASIETARPTLLCLHPEVVLLGLGPAPQPQPDMIGRIKALLPQTHVLAVVGEEEPGLLMQALERGACGYCLKGDTVSGLAAALGEVQRGGAPVSSLMARKLVDFLQGQSVRLQPAEQLSWREREILECLSQGYPYKQIADHLQISINTVRTYIRRLYGKLKVPCRTHALLKCLPRETTPSNYDARSRDGAGRLSVGAF